MANGTATFESALRGTYFARVYLGLATLAYASESHGVGVDGAVTSILANPKRFPLLPDLPDAANPSAPPRAINGYWTLDWGGDVGDNANAILLVSFRTGPQPAPGAADGAPLFVAVCNRGTDTVAWKGAVLVDVFEDVDSVSQRPWSTVLGELPNPSGRQIPSGLTGKIASGTADALRLVTEFQSALNGQMCTVSGALTSLLTQYPGTPIVVTGHSLGGCLTQVVAAYLVWQLFDTQTVAQPNMLPNPFAPPTAGDADFAAMYDALFPNGHFWFNETDLVPCAWSHLHAIPHLWGSNTWPVDSQGAPAEAAGPKCSEVFDLAVAVLASRVPLYARPSVNLQALPAGLPTQAQMTAFLQSSSTDVPWDSWHAQLLWQHMPPCYHAKISAEFPDGQLAPFPLIDTNPPY